MAAHIRAGGETLISHHVTPNEEDIVQKNITAMSMISKYESASIRSLLDSFKVKVVLSENDTNENYECACNVTLNLLTRFLNSVHYAGPKSILRMPSSCRSKIRCDDADGDDASMHLIFGNHKPMPNSLYVSSSGWSVYLSQDSPCGWKPLVINRLAAAYAGGLAVGEVLKTVLDDAPSEKIDRFEYDLVTHGRSVQPVTKPPVPKILDLGDLTIVGCGAIGQALCFGLKSITSLAGKVTLIDHDELEPSNEQRYVLASPENRGKNKAWCMCQFLDHNNPLLNLVGVPTSYEDHANAVNMPVGSKATVAVDNILTRLNVQAGLPRVLWNAWTDVSDAGLRYGIGRHALDDRYECIWCAYFPTGKQPTEMEMNSMLTGFSHKEIQRKLDQGEKCTSRDLRKIHKHTSIPMNILIKNKNRPFADVLHGECGVYALGSRGNDATAPVPHVPFLAGVFLASQIVLESLQPSPSQASPTNHYSSVDFDGMGFPRPDCAVKKLRNPKCLCNDQDYKDAYAERWN